MRMLAALLLAALAAAAPAADPLPSPPVARWPTLHRLVYKPDYAPRALWIDRAQTLEGREGCTLAADATGVVRLRVPFVVLLSPKGTVLQAHADYPACPALADLIERFALDLGPKTLQPPAGTPPIWRASHFLAGWKHDAE